MDTMKQTNLPFCTSPFFTIYNNYSYIMGIIQGHNNDSFEPWAYGRYINCAFNPGFGFRVFGTIDMMNVNTDLICRVNSTLFPKAKWMSYWKTLLDDGIYIQANINEQYIPGKAAYNSYKYYHDSLIIGYNDRKQAFTMFTRLANHNMYIIDVPYTDVQKSLIEKGSWYLLFKYTPNRIRLDIPLIRLELTHYFYSSQSSNFVRGTRYGMKALEYLCEHLVRQYTHAKDIDYRLTRGISEHKALMLSMCKYLNSNGYDLSANILIMCKEAADAAQRIHLLALKSYTNVKSNNSLGGRIRKQFDTLIDCERKYIPMLLKQLSEY